MKLSIIVPIYNVESTLERCIRSIVQQSFTDFELLLVDDGTPDNSGHIADELASNDERIRVFHKSNGGLSDARNYGIDRAKGEYITFVDSDDELAPDTLQPLMQVLSEQTDIDILEYPVTERKGRPDEHVFMPENRMFESPLEWLADKGFSHCWVCNKIFRATLFDNVHFKKGKKYEDVYLIGDMLNICHNIVTTQRGMYIYHWNDTGIVAQNNMHLLLEAQIKVVKLLNIDTTQPKWHRLYMNMFTTQLHAYCNNNRILLQNNKLKIRQFTTKNERIKVALLNIFGVKVACVLFKLLHQL